MVDNRSFPFSAVGLVAETIGGVAGHGSGVLIAPDEFLTAAHVVWTQGVGAASNVFVVPGLNGSDEPSGEISISDFHYVQIADASGFASSAVSEEDFALLHLSRSVTGAGTMALSANFSGGAVHLTGYPNSSGVTTEVDLTTSVAPDAKTSTLNYTGAGIPDFGDSGGPLWTQGGNGTASVVGVVSTVTSAGQSAELSTSIVTLINSWITADHASNLTGAIGVAPIDIHTVSSATDRATVFGALGGDSVLGSGSAQWLVAGIGNESLSASGANTIIFGGAGSDTLSGAGSGTFMLAGSGPTRMVSGPGVQGMAGGASADVFEIQPVQANGFAAIYSFGAGDKVQIHALAGSPINTPALAEAFELTDGANTFDFLGNNAAGAVWLIVVGTPHLSASNISFV